MSRSRSDRPPGILCLNPRKAGTKPQPKLTERPNIWTWNKCTKSPATVTMRCHGGMEPSIRECLINLAYEINPDVADKLAACARKLT